jgi:predicted DNA binding CopG/RHH family protein
MKKVRNDQFLYDQEEMKLLNEIERGQWQALDLDDKEIQKYQQSAAYTKALQEKRQTTIRFPVQDIAAIKARAKELGIGYQNLIQALVHQYVEGKIKLEL